MNEAEVTEGLGLDTLKGRQWSIFKSCAIKGEGLEEGLDWFVSFILCLLGFSEHTKLTCLRVGLSTHCSRAKPLGFYPNGTPFSYHAVSALYNS